MIQDQPAASGGGGRASASRFGRGALTFASLTGGRLAGDLFTFIFFVVVANQFGELGAGRYSIALSLAGFLFIAVDFGLYYFYIQKKGQDAADGAELGVGLLVRCLLALLLTVVLSSVFALSAISDELAILIALMALSQFGYALRMGFSVVYVRSGHAHLAGALEAVGKLAGALLGILIIWLGGSLVWAVASQPITSLLAAGLSWQIVRRRYCRPSFAGAGSRLLPVLRATMPFGLSEMPRLLAGRTDVLALGVLLGPVAAGVYNAAFRIIFLLQIATHFAGVAIVAEASRSAARSEAALHALYAASLNLCLLIGVPSAAGIWLIAPRLIDLIYGADFAGSVGVLRLLAVVLLLSIFRTIIASFVTLSGLQAKRARMEWAAAATVVLACVVLIPLIGIPGAACAAALMEALLVVLFARQMWQLGARPQIGLRLGAALAGTVAFLALASALPPLPLVLEILVCMATYAAVLTAFPSLRRDELARLLEAARRMAGKRALRPR